MFQGHDGPCDYDALPYLSLPMAYTQPGLLAGLATLHGLQPHDASSASIVELGCGTGGNLIPLAARYPEARFKGFDISAGHVAAGRSRIAALGLSNIQLEQADIADLDLAAGSIDYLICHGVYSWVPHRVQQKILQICGRSLKQDGIAAVSYNVFPGWHMRLPMRELLIGAAGLEGTPQMRVAKARTALETISRSVAGSNAYGRILLEEARLLKTMPSSYILGEFLAQENNPVRFSELAASAGAQGLQFVCEADLDAGVLPLIKKEIWQDLRAASPENQTQAGQALDDYSGRPFRRSLLAKSTAARATPLAASRLEKLHFAAKVKPCPERSKADEPAFILGTGRHMSTRNSQIASALHRLSNVYPGTMPVEALAPNVKGRERILSVLLRLLTEGHGVVSTVPITGPSAPAARPKIWSVARVEAASGQPWLTSQCHVAVYLEASARPIAARLDGTHTITELIRWFTGEISNGRIRLDNGKAGSDASPDLAKAAANTVKATLQHLEDCAIFESGPSR